MLRVALMRGCELEKESFLLCSAWLGWQFSYWLVSQPGFALFLNVAEAWRESWSL